ncbi:MAG: EAL domain-containing protein [Acidimicrobiia bacterium]
MVSIRRCGMVETLPWVEPTGSPRHLEGVGALPDTLVHLSGDGRVLDCWLGWASDLESRMRPGDVIGVKVGDLLSPESTVRVMEGVTRALETGEVVSCVWQAGRDMDSARSFWQGRFRRGGADEVMVVIGDVTAEVSRQAAEQHVFELSRLVIAATHEGADTAVQDALRRTAAFVGSRGALVLVPDDDSPLGFTIAHAWTPVGVPADVPAVSPGRHSWLATFLAGLEEPVILETAHLPEEAFILRWIAREQGLVSIGLIPLVCDAERLGLIAVGFPTLPDRVARFRFASLGALGPLLLSVRERHQRERDEWLRHAEEQFRSVLHHSADIVLRLDDEARLVFVSPSVREILGYEPAELLGENVLMLLHPDDLPEALSRFEQFPLGSARRSRVLRIRHRDGSWRSIECVLTDLRDDPAVGGFVAVARDITEQLETQEALRQNERKNDALLRYSTDMVAVTDAQGMLLHLTPNQVLGYPVGSLVGTDTLEFVHPDDWERAQAAGARVLEQPEQSVRVELRVRHCDGSWRHFDVVMTSCLDDPAVGGIIVNGRDITQLVEAERERAKSEAEFRFLAERASDMIYRYCIAPEPGFEYVSNAAETMIGFTPAEFYADPELMIRRVHPDDRRTAITHLKDPRTAAERVRFRWRHNNGEWVWTEHRTVPIFDDEGRMVAAEGIARDITEQVRAETEIRERELLSRSVLESISGPAAVLDAEGTILRVNQDWTALMARASGGKPEIASIGANYLTLCDGAASHAVPGAEQAATGVRAVLSGAQDTFRFDYPMPLPDDERWFVMRVSPLRTETGGVVVHHVDITDGKRYEEQLARQALHDPLTGLANRALLADRLEGALGRARPRTASVGVLLLGLDRFNVVNDGLGHAAGDDLLVAVSARLLELALPGDTVARLSGDEFVVLREGLHGEQEPGALAKRLVDAFAAPLREANGEPITVTVSVGIALGDRKASGDELLRHADAAMHHAKERGRNRFEFFDKRLHARALTRLGIETELHHAIDHGAFRLVYQPIIDLCSGVLEGVEALLRWEHPMRGLLLPEEFLDVAEEAGLLVPIGDWVLREACRQARAWQDTQLEAGAPRISVNVAAQQMHHPNFVDEVRAAIEAAGIVPAKLMVELTETALMDTDVAHTATQLHNFGVSLAIDDFGTGYSSLSYLKRLPVDEVKIDRSFIDGLGHDNNDAAIVAAIVNMSHTLGLLCVAEGVETRCQRDALLALGCDHAQGFLFAKPAEPGMIDQLLAERPRSTTGSPRPFVSLNT